MLWGILPIMEDGVLVVFSLPDGSTTDQHRRLRKRIYGEETSSWGGRYRYRRKGVLDEIPHVLLYTGVVIIKEEDAKRLNVALKEIEATIQRRMVRLIKSDVKILNRDG
jgi:hypothetical protein